MDAISLFIGLLVFGVFVSAVMGWLAFFKVKAQHDQIQLLQFELQKVRQQIADASSVPSASPSASSTEPRAEIKRTPQPATAHKVTPSEVLRSSAQWPRPAWLSHIIEHWMVWLGGVSVCLAGVFMVQYSVDAGVLDPSAQIGLALITGLVLHGAAEWCRRQRGSDPVFASLAGGASITLYAALLASIHIYDLLPPSVVFIALAVVSLLTMALALVHGPVLAVLGILGAYVVPLLVDTGRGEVASALMYSAIITGSALLLIRYVYRPWLWWSIMGGALAWWALSLTSSQVADVRGLYLAVIAWSVLALPNFDGLLQGEKATSRAPTPLASLYPVSLAGILLAWGASLYVAEEHLLTQLIWVPMVVVAAFAAKGRHNLRWLLWATLGVQVAITLATRFIALPSGTGWEFAPLPEPLHPTLLTNIAIVIGLYSGLSLWHWWRHGLNHWTASITLLAPLVWLTVAYLLIQGQSPSLPWGVTSLFVGLIYATVASLRWIRAQQDDAVLWLTIAAHCAYSLAATMVVREALLTVAIAAQVLSLAWLLRRYSYPWLEWLLKGVLALVIARLTLNPWLVDYPINTHWSLYTYGGSALLVWLASRLCRTDRALTVWLEAASLHLLVLFLGVELRYWLYDGAIFAHHYTLTEAALNTLLWGTLSLVYYRRADISEHLQRLYHMASCILLVMSAASYAVAVLLHNPWWNHAVISSTPLFNLLLLAYGAPVLLALAVATYHHPRCRAWAFKVGGLALLLFITLEIRHLWRGGDMRLSQPIEAGEMYTYSVIWLLLALPAVLLGARWQSRSLNKAGMALLAVVIGKIFLIDMADLDGLWRVASFMGLGLALLGLAWLYQRISPPKPLAQ